MSDISATDLFHIAGVLRGIRRNTPRTIGDALLVYGEALNTMRIRGVHPAAVLFAGELIWCAIRPEQEPAPDAIGAALDVEWG